MKIAVEGCCHDELEKIYETILHIQSKENISVDLLLICGDFQATRNVNDLQCMAVPAKYRSMGGFYKYYKGEKVAPVLTIVIGGNHEASNHMQELPYGGWLAPNIYFLGYAGIVNVGGVRIGGMSGISKGNYHQGHFEHPPYSNSDMRSAYHTRSMEVFRLKQLSSPVDIMMSHDWPVNAVHAGNVNLLIKRKPHFKEEIEAHSLGSLHAQEILDHIKPTYWFSAHLHCKYPAIIKHKCKDGEEQKMTKFLALDKCLPRRQFLQILDIPSTGQPPYKIKLDAEWLCILKNTNHLLNITSSVKYMPGVGGKERYDFRVTTGETEALLNDFGGDLTLPENFEMTIKPYDGISNIHSGQQPPCQVNPQTTLLCDMLGITDPFSIFSGKASLINPDEISLDAVDVDDENEMETESTQESCSESDEDDGKMADGLDMTNSDEFPTFLHGLSSNEGIFNDSLIDSPVLLPNSTERYSLDDEKDGEKEIQSRKRPSSDSQPCKPPETSTPTDLQQPVIAKKMKRRNVALYNILNNQCNEGGSEEPS